MPRSCFLRCLLDTHAPINLPHNVEIFVGRSKLTKIRDQSCSRKQISLKANCDDCLVEVKQLGINPSGLDGFSLKQNCLYKVGHESRIEIILNNYIHVIEFEPAPDNYISTNKNKRKIEDDDISFRKKRCNESPDRDANLNITEAMEDLWESIDEGELYIYTKKGVKSSEKIAGFDMDGTLIKTKSGKVHPVDTYDWQLNFPVVPSKLKEKLENGYKVVILSNQAPIGKGRVKIVDFKKKIENLVAKINIPVQVFIATGRSIYRKPTPGMWNILTEQKNDGIPVDMNLSFYCGDAAGRLANWAPGKKKDHSMADKLLAENLGLKFYTPEEFFLGHSICNVPMAKPEFIPREVVSEPFNDRLISNDKEILVMVGYPGSGKSFLAKEIKKKSYRYSSVCRDELGSWQKCAAEATRLLQQGKSVIVDSTNPNMESRVRWTSLAKEMKVDCRCVKMETSIAHAMHNNKFRELMKINHVPVNDIVFYSYKNKYQEPSTKEGFKEIIKINFNPIFDREQTEKLYKMYLLEK